MEEKDWRRLLDRMKEGKVVPVIGSRLLVGPDGASPLFAQLARQLLDEHDVKSDHVELPAFRELNEAVTQLKGKLEDDDDFDDLYGKISTALARFKADTVAVPQPLQQLAEITDFKLMVTLTPDDLLARALAAKRGAVTTVVHSPKLSTREFADLAPDWDAEAQADAVQLLYLFGRANKPSPLFAIHDEDVLEYAHNVISHGSNVPSTFLDALRERNLLLIGCNFPDWLSRFFLRATRSGPLAEAKGSKAWLVDRLSQEDPFIGFLGTYSPKTSVLSNIDPVQFVDELHRRWLAEQPVADKDAAATATATSAQAPAVANQPDRAVFFISYSRATDLDHALKLKQTLTNTLKVDESEIWFDKDELEPGDVFTQRILDGIRSCRYFLPIVSRAATARERAFVFREWDEATSLLPEMNRKFLLPLVVDDENKPELYDQPSVNAWRERNINFGHAPDGTPDPVTLKSLQDLLRKARSSPGSL
jgi:hypothetical protein